MATRPSPLAAILLLGSGFSLLGASALAMLVFTAVFPDSVQNRDVQVGISAAGIALSVVLTSLGAVAFRRFWALLPAA